MKLGIYEDMIMEKYNFMPFLWSITICKFVKDKRYIIKIRLELLGLDLADTSLFLLLYPLGIFFEDLGSLKIVHGLKSQVT